MEHCPWAGNNSTLSWSRNSPPFKEPKGSVPILSQINPIPTPQMHFIHFMKLRYVQNENGTKKHLVL
jgi:hypothetical protein